MASAVQAASRSLFDIDIQPEKLPCLVVLGDVFELEVYFVRSGWIGSFEKKKTVVIHCGRGFEDGANGFDWSEIDLRTDEGLENLKQFCGCDLFLPLC
jgi:hypothetical protein